MSSPAFYAITSAMFTIAVLIAVSATELSAAGRRRELARRARRVQHDPSLANLGDVRERLRRELPSAQAHYAWERILLRGIDAPVAWGWLHTYGAGSLVRVLAVGEGPAALKRVLHGDRAYDAHQVAVLAALAEPRLFDPVG